MVRKGQVIEMTDMAPYKMKGTFEDGQELTVGGANEADCMRKLSFIHENRAHGELKFYAAVTDENYQDGYLNIG